MSTTLSHPMSTYEARKATFLQKESVAGPSRKKAGSASKLSWPHPISSRGQGNSQGGGSDNGTEHNNNDESAYPSPRSLANLGLYYNPTPTANDQCTVFPDGQSIYGWRQGQSAYDRMMEEDPTISWVMIETSKRATEERKGPQKYVWTQEESDITPIGKAMIDARLRTFGGAWPLDGKKGWKPTSKKLSSAGFHFAPNEDEEDCVTCAYCQCSLGGWEKTDDPVKEHQKRKPECVIFNSTIEKKAKESASRAASTSSGKGKSNSKKRVAELMEEDAGDEVGSSSNDNKRQTNKSAPLAEEDEPAPTKAVPTQKTKAAKTPKKTTKKKTAPVEEKEEEANEEEIKQLAESKPKKTSKKVRSKAATKPKAAKVKRTEDDQMDIDEKMVEASDFEEEPSRSHSRDSEKMSNERMDSPPTSCESETYKTPKQTNSARISQKTPKSSTPPPFQPIKNGIPALRDLDLTEEEKSMTVEEWLKSHVKQACDQLEKEGNRKIAEMEETMNRGRLEAEKILRGQK